MSSGARIGLVVAAVAAIVLAFVILSPRGDNEPTTASTPTTTAPAPGADHDREATETATTPAASPPPPAPTFETIRVKGGKPVGGLKRVTVKKGDRARIRVSSTDTSDEIHLHGYDKYANVAPGRPASFSFEANAEGIFEIELHGTGTQIAKLVVEP